jgi:hypothetical protein
MLLHQQLISDDNAELLSMSDKQMQTSVDATQMAVYRNYSGGGSGSQMGGGSGVAQGSNLGFIKQRA